MRRHRGMHLQPLRKLTETRQLDPALQSGLTLLCAELDATRIVPGWHFLPPDEQLHGLILYTHPPPPTSYAMSAIRIRGARTHNLKNIEVELPRDRLIVFTGLSGSGKSSLAFDTIYAEGQRRYVESLSTYARQFLSMMEKPDVDTIEGLSPAIAIEQKSASHNPRSTVGTVTEIYDYLRLLFARAGIPRCPEHGQELAAQTVSQMVDQVLRIPAGTALLLLAPVVTERKGEHLETLEELRGQGFVRARIDRQGRRARRPTEAGRPAQAHHRGRDRPLQGARRPGAAPCRVVRNCPQRR